jgi:tetratricopeptide (TPR) repeat protein
VSIGNAYRKLYNGTEAYKAYHEALDKDDKLPEAYYQLGKIFETQKNPGMYLDFYTKAIDADKEYAPAYYALYEHYLYVDPPKAMDYFQQYSTRAEKRMSDQYSYTDLLYLTKKYEEAIANAKELIATEGEEVKPRLYKLIAYSYQDLKDTSSATDYMLQYFQEEEDSNYVVKDFETMAGLYLATQQQDSAVSFYARAAGMSTDSAERYSYYKTLASLTRSMKDYAREAQWLGKYYMGNDYASNVDLFNWGLASFRASDYVQADSVFAKYATKYPEQGHGYYWRARSNAAIDTAMTEGLAIPHYQQLIEVIRDEPSDTEKKWLVQAYGYLAAYETNTEKDYAEAITYFEELLKMDPENQDAKEYIAMLEKRLDNKPEEGEGTNATN